MKYIRPILRSKLFRFFFIIYLAFFVFDKAFSIDLVLEDGTNLNSLTIGQLQNFPIADVRFVRFYSDEFEPFSQYGNTSWRFRFYGQPGTVVLDGNDLLGDLSNYSMLMSVEINQDESSMHVFESWFLNFPYESLTPEEPDNGGGGGGGGSDFDINDLDYNLAATFFAGGFAIFLLPWLNAYGFSALLSFIKRA
jgi:hypothetical protein